LTSFWAFPILIPLLLDGGDLKYRSTMTIRGEDRARVRVDLSDSGYRKRAIRGGDGALRIRVGDHVFIQCSDRELTLPGLLAKTSPDGRPKAGPNRMTLGGRVRVTMGDGKKDWSTIECDGLTPDFERAGVEGCLVRPSIGIGADRR
jgi:translation initiation factor IF-1